MEKRHRPPAEARLARDARRLLRLVESVPDRAIFLIDRDGRITTWNRGGEQCLGYRADEAIGRVLLDLFPEEDRHTGRPPALLAQALAAGRIEREQPLVRRNGEQFWAMLAAQPTHDDKGNHDGFGVGIRDISEQHAAHAAFWEAEERFRILVQSVTDYALIMLDRDGRVSSWNTGAARIKGYAAGEIIGQHFSCFYLEEDRAAGKPAQTLHEAHVHGHFTAEGWRVKKDGSRFWANVVLDPMRNQAGELIGFVKIVRDITERREMQMTLERTREELFQAQKMEAIGQLTGGIAHDFNNLLTVIRGGIELAERHAADPERLQRLLRQMQTAADRASTLTHQMLAFSRRQTLQPVLVELSCHLTIAAEFLDRSLRGDIQVVMDVAPGLWPVLVDPQQLDLALLNVGLNARDAMPDGGVLRISAGNVVLDGEQELRGYFVRLAVSDQGTGIPPHLLHKVIEPFFTTKEIGKGTGMGLSQAYGFARQSGGALALDSRPGHGTTVSFYLPAEPGLSQAATAHAALPPTAPSGIGTVLVVEDDPAVAEMAVAALEKRGYTVSLAHDAEAALEQLDMAGCFDLVFSDIVMPGRLNGVQLAEKVRSRMPATPVLLTTGYADAAMSVDARRFPILSKPYDLQELATRVASLIKPGGRKEFPSSLPSAKR